MSKTKRKTSERVLAAALSVALTVSHVPLAVIAEGETELSSTAAETTTSDSRQTTASETASDETTATETDQTESGGTDGASSEITSEEPVKTEAEPSESTEEEKTVLDSYILQYASLPAEIADAYEMKINGSTDSISVGVDEEVTLQISATAETEKKYRISSVRIGNTSISVAGAESYEGTIKITEDMADANGDITISVEFMQVYIVHFTYDSTAGSIVPSAEYTAFDENDPSKVVGTVLMNQDDTVGFTAKTEDPYRISEVRIDEQSTAYTENSVKEITVDSLDANQDHTVEVIFSLNTYKIETEKTIENGKIDVTLETVDYGGTAEVTVTPSEGYYIQSLMVNDEPVDASSVQNGKFEIANITEDKKISAVFRAFSEDYSWNADAAISQQGNSYVFNKNTDIVFETEKTGIRLIGENDAMIVGDETTKSVVVPYQAGNTIITAIEIYYPEAEYAEAGWHRIVLDNQLDISFYGGVSAEFVLSELAKDCTCYNSDVTLKLNVEVPENFPQIASIAYRLDSDADWTQLDTDKREIVVSAEENNRADIVVYALITDADGNETQIESKPFSINTTVPTAKVTSSDELAEGAESGHYNSGRTISVTIIDRDDTKKKDISMFTISRNGEALSESEINKMISWSGAGDAYYITLKFDDEGEYDWEFSYINAAGLHNEGAEESGNSLHHFVVDKSVEEAVVNIESKTWKELLNVLTFGIFGSFEITVTAEGKDSLSGISSISYYIDEAATDTAKTQAELEQLYQDDAFTDYTGSIIVDGTKKAAVYVRFTDGAGNVTYRSSSGMIIENQKSVIQLSADAPNENGVYNQDVNVHISVEETPLYSGIKEVTYWVTADDQETQRETLYEFTNENPSSSDLLDTWNGDIVVDSAKNDSSNVVLHVQVTDNAGNVAEETLYLDINVTAPKISIAYDNNDSRNDTYFNAVRNATVTITDRIEHFDSADATSGIVITAMDAEGNVVDDAYTISDWDSDQKLNQHTATIAFAKDANYTIAISYTNRAGNSTHTVVANDTAAPFSFTVDTQAPSEASVTIEENTWAELLEILSFGFFSNSKFEVTASSKDATSPIELTYYISTDESPLKWEELDALNEGVWQSYPDSGFELPKDDNRYVVYLKATDYAGNYIYVCSDRHVIDNQPSVITLTPENANENGAYNKNVAVHIDVVDEFPYSGIYAISYWVTNSDETTQEGTLYTAELDEYETQWDGDITIDSSLNNAKDAVLHVKAIDNAGNEAEKELPLDIDITAPTITVSYDNNESTNELYFDAVRKATVTIEKRADHFDPTAATKGIKIEAVDKKGKKIDQAYSISNWITNGDIHTATIDYYADAVYSFAISYTDQAGNLNDAVDTGDSVAPYKFVIDTTAPTGTITAKSDAGNVSIQDGFSNGGEVSFNQFENTRITVIADTDDNLTDITEVVYFKDSYIGNYASIKEKTLTTDELENIYLGKVDGKSFAAYPNGITMNSNEKAVVYVRFTDSAGNVSYRNTEGLITDNQKPGVLSIITDEEEGKNIQNRAITFTVDVSDALLADSAFSGIQEIYYFVSKDGEKIGDNHSLYEWDAAKEGALRSSWSGTFMLNPHETKEYNQDNLDVSVIVIDNAGNVYGEDGSLADVSMNIDELKITVTFEDDFKDNRLDGKYFQSRKASIKVENDRGSSFNESNINDAIIDSITATEITKSNGETIDDPSNLSDLITITEWITENDNVHYATIEFNYCGNYTWKNAEYENNAGNKANILEGDIAFTIDTVKPTGTITVAEKAWSELVKILTFGIYDPKSFEVSISADDLTSSVRIDYYICNDTTPLDDEALDALPQNNWVFYSDKDNAGHSFTITDPNNYVIYVRITDYAGNYIYISSDGHIIDNQESTINIELDQPNANGIYNKGVKAHIDIVDAFPYSGINTVTYWVTADGNETLRETLYEFDKSDLLYSELVDKWSHDIAIDSLQNNSCNVVLHVQAIDNAGNVAEATANLDIDVTAPAISVSYDNNKDNNGNSYFDAARKATIVITERTHHFDPKAATEGITITAVDAKGNPVDIDYSNITWTTTAGSVPDLDTHKAEILYSADANYTFAITYTDKADNTNTEVTTGNSVAPYKFTVDKTPPTGTVTALSAEGRSDTWNELVKTLSFGFWSNTNINISGTSDDVTSPIASVQYYKYSSTNASDATNALTVDELNAITKWETFNGLDVKPNEQFTVYLKIVDMAGNVTYISTNGLIVDNKAPHDEITAPEIKITPEQTESGIYNGDVTLSVLVDDPLVGGTYSGLKTVSYRVYNMGQLTQNGVCYSFDNMMPLQSNLQKTWTGEIKVDSGLNNSNDVLVEVYAEDNAGNSSTETISLKIDITPPSISVSYTNNSAIGNLFKAGRTAVITIRERNFSRDYVNLTVTKDGSPYSQALNWTQSGGTGNGDNTIWRAELPFTADGDYTFAINCTDLAANKSGEVQFADGTVYPTNFTIDGTAPQISVVFSDVDDSPNGIYYKGTRTATITIEELHFDAETATAGVTVSGDNDGTAVKPVLTSWTSNGNIHRATVTFSEDAKYQMKVSYTDQAGNDGTSFNTEFYVDNIDPNLEITVNDNNKFGAYKDDVLPVISYHDVNFDSNEVSIEMTGINVSVSKPRISGDDVTFTLEGESGKKINWTASIETNEEHYGQVLTFEDFPEGDDMKEFDDIYTLTVSLIDKSGRQSTTPPLTFSVNRYGSTYDISAVKDMLGAYMQEESTVVVEEINPDALTEYSITLFKNNETLTLNEGTDYEVNAVGSDGEWHSYTYTIHQDNFAEDGIYSLTLHSKDKAGNISENTLDTKDSNISFAVDKTPPMADITNLEDGKTYVEQSRTVLMTANDNLKLAEIAVYLDSDADIFKSWSMRDIEDMQADENNEFKNQYTFDILGDSTKAHNLRVVYTDASGRTTELAVSGFFVTPNRFVAFINNRLAFFGSLAGLIALIGGIIAFVIGKKKKRRHF